MCDISSCDETASEHVADVHKYEQTLLTRVSYNWSDGNGRERTIRRS